MSGKPMEITPARRSALGLIFGLVAFFLLLRYTISLERQSGGFRVGLKSAPSKTVEDHASVEHGVDLRLKWEGKAVPPTKLLHHYPGWTTFDRLYMLNGTQYIVTDSPADFPAPRMITSSGYPVYNGDEEVAKREPTGEHMRVISTKDAARLFGSFASRLDGVTFFANDPPQFINHYYHFAAELLFGFWRTYSSLDTSINAEGETFLPSPRRLIFGHAPEDKWRDYAKMNQWIAMGAFPSMAVETEQAWLDRAETNKPFVFDRIVFADRAAAMRGERFPQTGRSASGAFELPGSMSWWSPVRANVLEFSGTSRKAGWGTLGTPVITYISRQNWGRRMLIPKDHDGLVAALHDLRDTYGYEVNIVEMDKLSREEQFDLAGRTTVMLGVHGNGLSSLLWMNPTPRSTVIEFFFPGGFAMDYEWTTRALGMVHYGFWGSDSFTSPKLPPMAYPEGFQGNAIPCDGKRVAELIHYRLSMAEEADD